ncbi:SubName: Full=Related to RNA polymerase II-associated protein-Laccaria bicolor {ECO:0000313/EMBL:CCA66853.1} [Serendipita indica DSM 11827]|nr:SubName: Full=Related to RNA polymerase II-associated protein-Laccaria bicolor {ECO:0000313/EMBL:CCA66853.1} [Serendipita indica DSM 11827]
MDALVSLRSAIASKQPITFLNAEKEPEASLANAVFLLLPQPSQAGPITLAKSTPTRLRKPNHTQTDPNAHPADFYALDAVYLAWSLREAATAEYMKSVRDSGIGITNMVAITEKQSVVDWLERRMDSHPNIVPLQGSSSSAQEAPQKKRYVVDTRDLEAVKRIRANEVELKDRNAVLCGSKTSDFSGIRALIQARIQKLREAQAASAASMSSSTGPPSRSGSKSPSQKHRQAHPIIMISSSPTALITMWNVKKFLQDSEFVDSTTAKARAAEENTVREDVVVFYRKRTFIEPGGRETETQVKYFVVDGIEALNKFGADPWERVVCVLTTGQAWQFRPYKWSEPRELFHRVKGFYISWTNDPPNPKVKDWNVTELKIDPNKRHLDKSTVAQFWKMLDSWIGTSRPNLLT